MSEAPELLTADTCAGYLRDRGVVSADASVIELGGGVSNVVLLAESAQGRFVVKQALPKLRVADDWRAKQERTVTEAAALRLAARLAPGSVPNVVDSDPDRCVLVIEAAPPSWTDWKQQLLARRVDVDVARALGNVLGHWHHATAAQPELAASCDDPEAFEQLRVDPYLRTVQARHPDFAALVQPAIDHLVGSRTCLVHGDFSPKNVLVGDGSVWVVDFEVAHVGAPEFDVAFMLCHLVLKAIHVPSHEPDYRDCAAAFLAAYADAAMDVAVGHDAQVARQLGCLLLARVDGKSPAEYLTKTEQARAWEIGTTILQSQTADLTLPWQLLERARSTA
jgi:tRNA A-37 threonylcarbamoyl transferase component Bud32